MIISWINYMNRVVDHIDLNSKELINSIY